MNESTAIRKTPPLPEPVTVNADASGPTGAAAGVGGGCVLLCPGQGAQRVGMGHAWVEQHAVARRTFEEAEQVLGLGLRDLCFTGPAADLNRTDIAQVAIYVTSVAAFRAQRDAGRMGAIAAAAGLSLGEFTALHLAGAFDFVEGLRLVRLRGLAMQEAAQSWESGMVALKAAEPDQAERLCLTALDRVTGPDELLAPANFNCPGQVVISGTRRACEAALAVAVEMGVAARALAVAGAFHSPVMQPAARRLAAALDQLDWSRPKMPVIANVTGRPHDATNVESIKGLLVKQLTRPVLWESAMRWLLDHAPVGAGRSYVELPPGQVLAGLMRRIDRKVCVEGLAEPG